MLLDLRRTIWACLAFVGALCGSSASAEVVDVEFAADADWQHQWTSMAFPARVDTFEREFITAFEDRETNISARYFDRNSRTILSLYIYRPGNASTSIWFDRALMAIGVDDRYGEVDLEGQKISRFVPSGGSAASGLSAVLAAEGGDFRSTGVALYRAGEWLVKVRISSAEQSVAQLDTSLRRVLDGLPPLDGADGDVVEFVTRCDVTLSFSDAEPVTPNTSMALELAFMTDIFAALDVVAEGDEIEQAKAAPPKNYCREGDWNAQYNLYHPVDSDDRYSLILGDSGSSVEVYPFRRLANANASAEDQPTHLVVTSTGTETSIHTPFRGLPNLGPASQSAFRGPVYVKVNRVLGEDDSRQITIASDLEGEEAN